MKNPSKRITWKEISRQKFLMVCAAIFFVYGIVFYYVPLAGWVMAFQNYKPKDGLFGSKFVGLEKFKFLFSDDVFLRDIRNTLAMGVLNLVTTFLMAIIFAILLNEVRNIIPSIKYAIEGGMIPQATLCITHSPVHTVEYYTDIADKLSQIDVDALNDVMAKLPATMDAVAQLQQQLNSVASFLGNVGSIFG